MLNLMTPQTYYYTKDQLLKVLHEWQVTEEAPKRGHKLVIAFPPGRTWKVATITLSKMKSTYGKPLYQMECA